ncbi:MAG: aldo/keto reductase [Lachnospiraceae bacterium]|nr:aldo/keto reductase [Lachnospiraceae bacterium]
MKDLYDSPKKLGFGLMRLPLMEKDGSTIINQDELKKMVDMYLERGFTYFDTAWMYHGGDSEKAIKEALVDRYPRDSFTLTTKLHSAFFDDLKGRDDIFYKQLEKTGVDYFDFYLIHDIERGNYDKFCKLDCFNWVIKKKEEGLVKHIGFSFHSDAELLERVLTEHPEMEFVQLQINYLDWESENVQSRKCYEVAEKHGKKVIIMEPVKGGSLVFLPDHITEEMRAAHPDWSIPSWAIRFAASHKNVFMVLSGMSNLAQMEDNSNYMQNFVPLTDEEQAICLRAAEKIRSDIAIPCTACSYCTDGCPMKIAIPKYFALYNNVKKIVGAKDLKSAKEEYEELAKTYGKASKCIGCGQCERICPQHLPIIEHLKAVAEMFES